VDEIEIGWISRVKDDVPTDENDNELTAALALRAYSIGVFPMAEHQDTNTIYWVDPRERGIMPLDEFRIPKRLRRTIRRTELIVRSDSAFDATIDACAESTAKTGRQETWINPAIRGLFRELFDLGYAHTIECWRDDCLVGGLYGLALGGAFFGESMFSRETDASKIALVHLAARLDYGGYTLLDAQFPNPHLDQFGAIEISRAKFRKLLDKALDRPAAWPKAFPTVAFNRYLKESVEHPSTA
jgi:leucyl/phenylalanyl-tRNA--protein transferase